MAVTAEDAQEISEQQDELAPDSNNSDEQQGDDDSAAGQDSQDDVNIVRQELDETKDKLLRLAADFENYKKRMERSRLDLMKYREEAFLKELLPVIDNLNRAIEQGQKDDENSELLKGVELTCKGLFGVLEKFEVNPIASVGEPFDPNIHDALAMEHSAEVEENHVLLEFEKGYQYKDRLIRPAKVVVSKGAAAN